jgi:O-antigen/teichoic acid export membrane protein
MMLVSLPMAVAPLLNMFFLVLAASRMDLTSFGNLSYCLVMYSFLVSFNDLGLRDYFLSKDGRQKEYSTSLNVFLVSAIFFVLIFAAQYYLIIEKLQVLIIFTLLSVEAFSVGVIQKSIYHKYQSKNQLTRYSKYEATFKVVLGATKISVLYFLNDLYLAIALSSMFSFIFYSIWVSSAQVFINFNMAKFVLDLRSILQDLPSWGFYTVSFLSFFLYFGADKLMVDYILGTEKLAIYSASMTFMAVGQMVVGVLWSLYMPRLSREENLWSFKDFMIVSLLLSICLVLVYAMFSMHLFKYFYPNSYSEGANVLLIASFYFIFRFPNVVLEIFYLIGGKYRIYVKIRVIFGMGSLVLSFILLPTLGIAGSALAMVISEGLLTLGLLMVRNLK